MASPRLATAWRTHETLTTWELRYFAPATTIGSGAGTQVNHYTVRLTGTTVVAIDVMLPDTTNRTLASRPEIEVVAPRVGGPLREMPGPATGSTPARSSSLKCGAL